MRLDMTSFAPIAYWTCSPAPKCPLPPNYEYAFLKLLFIVSLQGSFREIAIFKHGVIL
jgi:hypothetical protein